MLLGERSGNRTPARVKTFVQQKKFVRIAGKFFFFDKTFMKDKYFLMKMIGTPKSL